MHRTHASTSSAVTAMTNSPAADLLEWERQQSIKPSTPTFDVMDKAEEMAGSTEALTKAVAAKLRKRRKKDDPSAAASVARSPNHKQQQLVPSSTSTFTRKKSFEQLSKAQRRRLLWEVKLALEQKNQAAARGRLDSRSSDEYPEDETTAFGSLLTTNTDTVFSGYTNDASGYYTNDSSYISRYTGDYTTETYDYTKSTFSASNSYDDSTASTLSTLNTAELLHLESLMKSISANIRNKNGELDDDDDLEVEVYLDQMGLGMCTLESGLEVCCPWLICSVKNEEDELLEDVHHHHHVDGNEKDDGGSKVEKRMLERGLTEESENQEEEKGEEPKGEDLAAVSGWNLCGFGNVVEEDAESTIDWNGKGGGRIIIASDEEKMSFSRQASVASTAGESKPMTVKERLAQKMGFKGPTTTAAASSVTSDHGESNKEAAVDGRNSETIFQTAECTDSEEEDAVAMAEKALRAMNLPTLGQSCENEMAMASSFAKDNVPGTPKSSCRSTPSSKGSPTAKEASSVPSAPLKAVIVQEDATASPMSVSSSPVSMKQRIVQAFKSKEVPVAAASSATEVGAECAPVQNDTPEEAIAVAAAAAEPEFEEEGIEQGIDDQPPAIPSTPLKAVLPSTPLPASTQTTPVITETKSAASLSAKSKFARAMIKLKKDGFKKSEGGVVEQEMESRAFAIFTNADQPPPIPSTPLKAAIPSTPLPKSNPSTPVSAAGAAAAVSDAAISAVAVSSTNNSTTQTLASLAGLIKKEKFCEDKEERKKEDDGEPLFDAVVEVAIESIELLSSPREDEAVQPPAIPSTPLKATIPTTPLPASTQTTPLNEAASVSNRQKFARAMMKLKKKSKEEQPTNVEVDANANEDGIESVAPAITTRVSSSGVGEELIFIRETPTSESTPVQDANEGVIEAPTTNGGRVGEEVIFTRETPASESTPIQSTTSSQPGNVINVSDLLKKSSPSPLFKMARIVKRSKKHNSVDKFEERQVDITADGDEIESAVPALPDEKAAKKAFDSVAAEEPKIPAVEEECTDLARVTPTTPMLRLVKAMSFHSQASAGIDKKSQVDVDAVSVPPSMADAVEHIAASPAPASLEVPSTPIVEPTTEKNLEQTPHPPTFSMLHVLANAMSFMGEADDDERKTDSKVDNDVIHPAVAIEKRDASDIADEEGEEAPVSAAVTSAEATSEGPSEVFTPSPFGMMQILGQAMGFMTEDKAAEKEKDKPKPADTKEVASKSVAAAVTSDVENAEEENKEVIVTDLVEPKLEHTSVEDAESINTPIDITREMSIATQRINNKTTPDIIIEEPSDSIEFTQEMSIANQKTDRKSLSKLLSFRPKSIFSKAKSIPNETKSVSSNAPSVSVNSVSINSVTMSDYTEKVGNLSSTKKLSSLPKNKREKRWREYTDPSTGMKYYSNGVTTTWTKPSNNTESSDVQTTKILEDTSKANPTPAENATLIKDGCTKKSVSRLSLLLKSKSPKDKNVLLDDSSVCTDNITADSEGNISSPSKSVSGTLSSAEQEVSKEKEAQPEPSLVGVNILATDSGEKASTLTLDAETNSTNVPDTVSEEQKPKKKKKRRKGWREYTCPNTGNKYYSNGTITTWEKPAEFVDENVDVADAPKSNVECASEKRVTMISFA